MVNLELIKMAVPQDFINMGFKEKVFSCSDTLNQTDVCWELNTKGFSVCIDSSFEVQMCRLNPDTDYITLHLEDLTDLKSVVDWVQDDE